jgi:hypothetical protein
VFEDSYEMRIKDEDMISIPVVAWCDLTMQNWAEFWTINPEGKIKCAACAGEQASSRSDMPFIHDPHCRLKVDRIQRPWVLLKRLMSALPVEEGRQPSTF